MIEVNLNLLLFVIAQVATGAITYGVMKTEFKYLRRDIEDLKKIIRKYVLKIEE